MNEELLSDLHFESVTTYLSWDHDRLDAILGDVSRKVEAGRLDEARNLYQEFQRGLLRHIRIEEEILFPVFEAKAGMGETGPTAVMRLEHREIEKALNIMRDGLEADDPKDFREGQVFLGTILPDHNSKEEHILYPTTDRLLSEKERALLASRLQSE